MEAPNQKPTPRAERKKRPTNPLVNVLFPAAMALFGPEACATTNLTSTQQDAAIVLSEAERLQTADTDAVERAAARIDHAVSEGHFSEPLNDVRFPENWPQVLQTEHFPFVLRGERDLRTPDGQAALSLVRSWQEGGTPSTHPSVYAIRDRSERFYHRITTAAGGMRVDRDIYTREITINASTPDAGWEQEVFGRSVYPSLHTDTLPGMDTQEFTSVQFENVDRPFTIRGYGDTQETAMIRSLSNLLRSVNFGQLHVHRRSDRSSTNRDRVDTLWQDSESTVHFIENPTITFTTEENNTIVAELRGRIVTRRPASGRNVPFIFGRLPIGE